MKAIRYHQYGGPEVLAYEDVPKPEPGPGEVLIRVHAAGVNPADWQIRAGLRFRVEQPFAYIPGLDVSGVVEAVGDGVEGTCVGDAVYAMLPVMAGGGYARLANCPAKALARKPQSLSHVEAAALPVVGLTAWQALFGAAELSSRQSVLIHAASGGVGHIAVQLAKAKGAHVVGTCSERNADFVRSLGADEVIDYKATPFEDVVGDLDVVFDTVPRNVDDEANAAAASIQERSWQVLKEGGCLVSICNTPDQATAARHGVRGAYILANPNGDDLAEIAKLVDAGKVRSHVETVLPLRDAAEAHRMIATGRTRGKIVLRVTE